MIFAPPESVLKAFSNGVKMIGIEKMLKLKIFDGFDDFGAFEGAKIIEPIKNLQFQFLFKSRHHSCGNVDSCASDTISISLYSIALTG